MIIGDIMNKEQLLYILEGVKNGGLSPAEALKKIKLAPYEDIGFANVDTSRSLRHGVGEVIYGEGKTAEQWMRMMTQMVSLMDSRYHRMQAEKWLAIRVEKKERKRPY